MSLQKVSQTDALAWRMSQEFKMEFSSIGTVILKVCKCPSNYQDSGIDWGGSVSVCACVCVCVCVRACVRACVCVYDSL